MQNEIEIKILEINKKEITNRLKKIGAKKILDARLKVYFFDFPDKRLTLKHSAIRVRQEGEKVKINIKKNIVQKKVKQADEYETEVQDFDTMAKILKLIGLEVISEQEKDRISYTWKGIAFDIDTYPGIPTFIEIEANSVGKLRQGLKAIGKTLNESNTMTGKQLLSHYGVDINQTRALKF